MTADDLYGLPLDRFVAERGDLVRALRAEGRREEAAAVAARRKPSVAAWAVNQLVRTQAEATDELFAAGDGLRAAQTALLAGAGDARGLRAARDRERAAVDRLREAAGGLLDADGHELSPAVLDRVAETLRAAAVDDEAREQVRRGCLVRELRHAGLGGGGFELAAPAPGSATRARPARAPGRQELPAAGGKAAPRAAPRRTEVETGGGKGAQAADPEAERGAREREAEGREREREAERRAREREAERRAREREAVAAARAQEAAARRRAERAERAVVLAEERHQRAADAVEEAARALAEARAQAATAAAAYRQARVASAGVEPG